MAEERRLLIAGLMSAAWRQGANVPCLAHVRFWAAVLNKDNDRNGGAKRSTERLSAYWGIAIIQMLSSKACLLPGSLPQGFHRREARLERPVTTGHHLRLVQGG